MHFTTTAAILAFASSVLAQTPGFNPITKPTKDEVVPAGEIYEIDWQPSDNYTGTVTLSLLGGSSPSTLQDISVIVAGLPSSKGAYDWSVDKTLGKAKTYGIRLSLDSDKSIFQYSFPFQIKESTGDSGNSKDDGTSTSESTSATTTAASTKSVDSTITSVTTITSNAPSNNLSTTAAASRSVVTLTTTSAKSSTSATTVSSNPAAVVGASSFALFGGLAMAVFAL